MFTDGIAAVTPLAAGTPRRGDIILYRYEDSYQPGVIYPHVALWYAPGQTLSCDWGVGVGVGIHPLMGVPYEIHRPAVAA